MTQAKLRSVKHSEVSEDRVFFDLAHFEATTMHDLTLQVEILMLFNQQLDSVAKKLEAGELAGPDRKFLGHTLRGSAAAVGAIEIEALAQVWEAAASDQSSLLKKLNFAITRFREATAHYISP